jgi:hypothetical protein
MLATKGVFVGSIRFNGEDRYTQLNAHRARGETTVQQPWKCKSPAPGRDRGNPSGLAVLTAVTPNRRTSFAALGEGKGPPIFSASTTERIGSILIARVASATGFPNTFSFDPKLDAASVKPPVPFTGEATFTRNPDGSTSWSGSLGVALPGADVVSLTGPTFTADLIKPKTDRELIEALLGL